MKKIDLAQNSEEWIEARKGKLTGSKLKDIVVLRGTGRKIGFYQLIADRLAIDPDGEDVMDRGHRLEDEAIEMFEKETGKKVEQVGLCISDFNENIALSPDGLIGETEALEIKCLGSAYHLKAIIENEIPSDYKFQILQYFIVLENLKTLHFVFYDPRLPAKPYIRFVVKREEVKEDIEKYKEYEIGVMNEIDGIISDLAF